MVEKSLQEINLTQLCQGDFYPSPAAWEDQVLYFVLLDRFSDANEQGFRDNDGHVIDSGSTPMFQPQDEGSATSTAEDARRWQEAGGKWCGGSLKGLTSKIGYLKRLGVTAIWVSPVFKQARYQDSYHGYGIQNFLDVDPHFGSRDDLREMVSTAHAHGIYVVLDIILNHVGDVFRYDPDRYWTYDVHSGGWYLDPRWDGRPYTVVGYHDQNGQPTLPFAPVDLARFPHAWPEGAVWPVELQDPALYTCKGRINNWDHYPEYLEGDFYTLKDVNLGSGSLDEFTPSPALLALCEVYKFWMAYADLDGYRVDTVKHMDPGAVRYFTSVMHEFAQRLGKENFYLIGEITGGRERAFNTLEETGLNAALGIDDIPDKLEYMVKGYRNPSEYFSLFRNSMLVHKDSHIWFRNKVVTLYDDHDQVRKGSYKARFCAGEERWSKEALNVMAVNVTTLGIPCIYYGSEQCFDGEGNNDRYIRESMFGGEFGAFRSRQRHFFNEETPVYQELAKILALRKQKIALRRGRQYLRSISGDGVTFGLPEMMHGEMRSVVAWSRLFDDQELLVAFNSDPYHPRRAWVMVGQDMQQVGNRLNCLYTSNAGQCEASLTVELRPNGIEAVQLTVPAGGFVIYE